jgi:ABC-type transport system involved in multi-copper enzyme maturation permease subunit
MVRADLGFFLHTRRLKVILPIYIFLALIYPILYGANILHRPSDVNSYTLDALSELVSGTVLLVAMLAGDAISQDFGRQGFFTLTQPVRRSEIMLARTVAAFVFSVIALLVWIGIGLATGYAFYSAVVGNVGLILALSVLFAGSVVSFVVLFSSLFRSPTVSVTISVLVLWFVMPVITGILDLVGVEPWFLLTYAGEAIDDLAANSYPLHVTTVVATSSITVTTYTPYVWEAAAIMVAYLIVSLVLAWVVYSKKELTEAS